MYRKILLLIVASLLVFSCATVQPGANLDTKIETYAGSLKDYSLEKDCNIKPEDFQSFINRLILLGDPVTHPEHGRLRTHYTGVGIPQKDGSTFELAISLGKKMDAVGITTVAVDLGSNERAEWFDVDEDGMPELVDRGIGKGRQIVDEMDIVVYCRVILILMSKPIYYPPKGE